jgi:glycosyltransferase involved in cell wall biosynthesis
MRVLHVCESARGGVATYLRSVIPAQIDRYGADAVFGLVPKCRIEDVAGVFPNIIGARWHGRSPLSLFTYFASVLMTIRSVHPDVINAHGTFAALFVRLAMVFMFWHRPTVIYVSHGWAFTQEVAKWQKRTYAIVEWLLLPLTDGVVHISNDQAQAARSFGLRPHQETMIYNGVPRLAEEQGPKARSNQLRIVFVGRWDRQKGLDILLEALKHVKRTDVLLKIAGDSVRGDQHLKLPDHHSDRIQVLGWCNQEALREIYREADVVVMPSRWEGFGLVALEAMRQSTAVFASNRGALPEIVVQGETGSIFDLAQPLELARLIDEATQEELHHMGRNGKRRFEEVFTDEACSHALMNFYDQCTGPRHAHARRAVA